MSTSVSPHGRTDMRECQRRRHHVRDRQDCRIPDHPPQPRQPTPVLAASPSPHRRPHTRSPRRAGPRLPGPATAVIPSSGSPTTDPSRHHRPNKSRPSTTPNERESPMSTATPNPAAMPSVHRRALLTWIAVYPAITVAQLIIGPHVAHWPVAGRTLIVT